MRDKCDKACRRYFRDEIAERDGFAYYRQAVRPQRDMLSASKAAMKGDAAAADFIRSLYNMA